MNLSAEMSKLTEPPNDSAPPHWNYWRHDLWQRAQDDAPENFANWPCIYHTMLVEHWWPDVMQAEYDYVWDRQPISAMEAEYDHVWNRPPTLWPQVDTTHDRNMIHQAYHILRWQEETGLRISDMQTIYEFGGGYGAMALVCNRLGFKGRYCICDLPEFSLLQQWYLEECGVEGVEWVGKWFYGETDLFIACYSLSETDFDERNRVLKSVMADSYLFLYSNKFEQYDNIEYFRGIEYGEWWAQHWRHERVKHLPPESWYTWGW